MEIYRQNFTLNAQAVDCHGRLKPSTLLAYLQEVAGNHFELIGNSLDSKGLFWAVSRHRVIIQRMPTMGETVTVETWPMPTSRVAYPRAMAMYDAQGNLLAQAVSLWILMDKESRAMVLPGKSGVIVEGIVQGTEPELPRSFSPKDLTQNHARTVTYSELDVNGHMNNTRYLDWVADLLPSQYHSAHPAVEFTVCYHAEAREGQEISLEWGLSEDGILQVDAHRKRTDVPEKTERVFTAQMAYRT